MITHFRGQYAYLSNFYYASFEYDGARWKTAEHAFQAAKSLDPKVKRAIGLCATPQEAKKLGRKIFLRPDWGDVRVQIMFDIVLAKFQQNADLAEKLLQTGDKRIYEENNWGDTYWGVDARGNGYNRMGAVLMKVRLTLRESGAAGPRGD